MYRRGAERHGRDAVAPGFLAPDAAVCVVVVKGEGVDGAGGGLVPCSGLALGLRAARAVTEDYRRGGAGRQGAVEGGGFAAVDGEIVLAFHCDLAGGEPATVHGGLPFGGGVAALAAPATAVHVRRDEGEIEKVGREAPVDGGAGGAEAAVVGLRDGDDVLDIRLARAAKGSPGVGAVHPAAHGSDDAGLDRLGIGIVGPVVGRAAVLGRNGEAVPGVGAERVASIGLSLAEGRVTVLLAEGKTVREVAAATGRSEATIRWHIRQIFENRGITRLGQLVSLVRSLARHSGNGSQAGCPVGKRSPCEFSAERPSRLMVLTEA